MLKKKQHLYSPVIYCKWLSTLNRGTTVYEYIFFPEIYWYIDSVGVDFDEDGDNSIDPLA